MRLPSVPDRVRRGAAIAAGIIVLGAVGFVGSVGFDDTAGLRTLPSRNGLITLSEAETPAHARAAERDGGAAFVSVGSPGATPRADYVPDEIVLRFDPRLSAADRDRVRRDLNVELVRRLPMRGLELVALPRRARVADVRADAERRPGVLYAEPNFIYRASELPDDEHIGSMWAFLNSGQSVAGRSGTSDADIDAAEAWDVATGSDEVRVAVVDSGVAYDHPDLLDNIWTNPGERLDGQDEDGNGFIDDVHGWDWVGDDADPRDQHGHGTHIAGTIGATGDNGTGVAGAHGTFPSCRCGSSTRPGRARARMWPRPSPMPG